MQSATTRINGTTITVYESGSITFKKGSWRFDCGASSVSAITDGKVKAWVEARLQELNY